MTDNPFSAPVTTALAGDEVFAGEVAGKAWPEVKKLRNASRAIRILGALWVFGALIIAVILVMGVFHGTGTVTNPSFIALFAGILVLMVVAIYGAWVRPSWGRLPGQILCVFQLLQVPIGTAIGILGLISFRNAKPLFGPDALSHQDLEARYRALKSGQKTQKRRTQAG